MLSVIFIISFVGGFSMKHNRFLSFLLAVVLCLPFFASNIQINKVEAITASEVTAAITKLKNSRYPEGYCWYNEYATDAAATAVFNGSQCVGFARNVANLIFGCFPNTSVQYVSDGAINNGWQAIKNVSSVQPGDIIHVYNHAAMVYYLNGDTIYVTEAWGSSGNTIHYGYFNGNIKNSTLAKIKENNTFYGIWRYTGIETNEKWYDDLTPVNLGNDFYAYISNKGTNMILSNIDSKNVQGCEQVALKNQIWHFNRQSDGSYSIISYSDNNSMDTANYGTTSGTNIGISSYVANTAQKFFIYKVNDNYFFRPQCSDLVFDMDTTSYDLATWPYDSSYSSKQFEIIKIDCGGNLPIDIGTNFYAYIANKGVDVYLSNVNNQNVQGCEKIYSKNQIWMFVRLNDGSYSITSYDGGKSMDTTDYGTTNGTNIGISAYVGNTAQKFFIYNINGNYFFKPECSELVFDMDSSSYDLTTWPFDKSYTSKQFDILKLNVINTISFNSNGGMCSITSKTVAYGDTYGTFPTPTRTGYTFNGWYTAASGGSQVTSSSTVTITSNQNLYAQWTPNQYALTVNPNGGSYKNSTSVTVLSPNLIYNEGNWWSIGAATKTGYTLTGYYTSASGGTKVYDADGYAVKGTTYWDANNKYCYDGNLTVYAQWEKNKVAGDVNADGTLSIADAVMLQKWLLCVSDAMLTDWQAADMCDDDIIDVFDLCIIKRELLKKS